MDVREHLAAVQRSVLSGCTVVFSRVIPLDMPQPEQHPLWQLAEKVGDVIT